MTYAEILDALYDGKPLHGVFCSVGSSVSDNVTISPIIRIAHMSSEYVEIPYIEINYFRYFEMEQFSLYMTEDNTMSYLEPGAPEPG